MFRPRVIPVLLLNNRGLVKTVGFKNNRYIGDPINAVRLFNDLKADELVFLDITASRKQSVISLDFVKNVGEEANMPFAVGGGIHSLDDIKRILNAGAEKVVINTHAIEDPSFVRFAADKFGSSAIVICIDVKKNFLGKERVWILNGSKTIGRDPVEIALLMEKMGAGEIIIQSIENDGSMLGYDINLIRKVSEALTIPVIALGGAGNNSHLKDAIEKGHASAVAAGSMFVFHGPRRAVLVNYPSQLDLLSLFDL